MKLVDIKKLKVPDLRSKLRELGLDSAGLKAELVGRLWSFHETRTDAQVEEASEITGQNDTPANQTETENPRAASPSLTPTAAECCPVAGVPPHCDVVPTVKCADAATQTETDSSPQTAQLISEVMSKRVLEQHQQQDGSAEAEPSGAANQKGRGRAFYEFKEEIRYKRWSWRCRAVQKCF